LCYALGKISNGLFTEFLGGRRMFLVGMFASVLCSIAFGFASGALAFTLIWMLNRYVQSTGWVALVKITSRWIPVQRHATVMGFLSMSYLIGDALTRWYLGEAISWGAGWRGVFLISAATLAVVALVSVFTLKSSPHDVGLQEPAANPANVFGEQGEQPRPTNLKGLLGPLLTNRVFWLISAINFGLTLLRESFNFWVPTYLFEVGQVNAGEAAIKSLLFPLVGAVAVLVAGKLSDSMGGRHGRVLVPSLALLVVATFALATIPTEGKPELALGLICAVSFFLLGPYSFLSGVMALDIGGKQGSSTAAGLVDSAGYLGAVLSGLGIGALAENYGWSTAFGFLAGVALVTAVIGVVYWRHHEALMSDRGD